MQGGIEQNTNRKNEWKKQEQHRQTESHMVRHRHQQKHKTAILNIYAMDL